ncbi:lysine (K)-specific demethylase 2Aa isoform X3 [Conger conger]|uniref:lysine (K)-specific demethylase 2Aa isoform X3 n=1 Tax=Conger conger TaxID=82655 RepID=UPI002A5A081C|nr:lysine (K)-specific demethylase 2Aa isoform X3 [Conger conger]
MEDRPRYSKRLRSGTRRRYQDDGISDDEIEGKRTFDLEEKLKSDRFSSDRIKRMEGKDFTFEYIQRGGLRDPIIFEKPDGLGIKMPDPDFSVNDVKVYVGSRRVIDVMDVTTQKGIEMSMAQWRRYYETPPAQREKLYNVISLEFSHTKLENLVQRPASVDIIDWVDNMWPRHLKERQRDSTNAILDMQYPKVQKYCLMSVQGCFTDFHVDFGGTSVWYHILRGGKVFWLIPPTSRNLDIYENWVLSGKQGDIFLGDKATDCQRIELKQGYTFMIPSGWIHAVYTPVDTLVFGGNFLHSFNIPMQLHISSIEDRTRVPAKFRYPFYYEMCWYVLERYLYSLTNTSHLTPEFQKHSLGIGLKREPSSCSRKKLNGHVKDEDDEEDDDDDDDGDDDEDEDEDEDEESEEPASPPAKPGVKVHLTPFELEGLWNLLGKLESLPPHKKCVPAGIHNAPALLHDIRTMLQEHAGDSPKLSYTGVPIIRWPKRPSWYQPPPPPPPVGRPRLSNTVVLPRPVKPPSSMSVLRRRRVRCKRCEACLRTECGECNFCRDMKKFGGPGKLKQTCVLRQCLAPGLPLSAACEVCGEGNPEPGEATAFSLALMECSNCAQITHPGCLKVSGEGVVNKDLPSCWECPKCVLGKDSESEIKLERTKILHAKRKSSSLDGRSAKLHCGRGQDDEDDDDDDDDSGSEDEEGEGGGPGGARRLSLRPRGAPGQRVRHPRGAGPGRRGLWRGSAHRVGRGGGLSSAALRLRRGGGRGERGGRVRLRGGGRMQRRRDDTDDDDDDDDDDEEDDEDEESEDGRVPRRRGRAEDHDQDDDDDDDEEDSDERDLAGRGEGLGDGSDADAEGQSDSDPDPPVLLVSDLSDDLLNGSYLTVTLQRPPKAKRHPGSIVPKLEAAVSARTPQPQGYVQRKTLQRPRQRNGNGLAQPRPQASPSPSSSQSSVSPTPPPPASSCSPPWLLSLPSFRDVGNEPGCEKEVWVSVFRYLSRAELCVCMTVCKSWYKWSCDKRLWTRIDLSRCRSVSPQALSGITKRQPVTLDLSWTSISKKQLSWLINRLPGLKDLLVSGCSWSSISALSSTSCPLLRTLDLRWAEGVKDSQIRDLITPPGCDNRSKLRNMQSFRLAGLEISDSTLRLIIRHMPLLARLDLAHCRGITDQSVNLLTAVGSSTRNTLTEINLAGCNRLTDGCLLYLRRLSGLTLLDLRGCKGVTRRACEGFISELSINALFCLSEDKLVQRIS